jgi:hypothetical protein
LFSKLVAVLKCRAVGKTRATVREADLSAAGRYFEGDTKHIGIHAVSRTPRPQCMPVIRAGDKFVQVSVAVTQLYRVGASANVAAAAAASVDEVVTGDN